MLARGGRRLEGRGSDACASTRATDDAAMALIIRRVALPVAVLDLAAGDFLERDLEVVLGAGLDHRRRVLVESALAEVVVVGVDLPGALGGDQHARVVRVDLLEQLVQAGLDHHQADMVAASSTSSSSARSRSSFTTTCWNSSWAAISSCATARRSRIWSGASEPRARRRCSSVSCDGGAMNTCTASGSVSRTWRAPWRSISSTIPRAGRSSSERS